MTVQSLLVIGTWEHNRTYECRANNSAGNSSQALSHISVVGEPLPSPPGWGGTGPRKLLQLGELTGSRSQLNRVLPPWVVLQAPPELRSPEVAR